ncbi:MAG: (d)CMP kinase [candidate division Zixibacteria bacterium]|nr:(d)CMP kinase [candidate division Zixibacteria bacterium]
MAIDGPAGSGKSTTAKIVAERLGYTYLDTGAMYRALTYYALENKINPADEKELAEIAEQLPLEFRRIDGGNLVFLNGQDISKEIRTPEVTKNVSEISAHLLVRRAMVAKQKEFGKNGSIVAEGRDTTTVVFPDADLKIYMDASVKERAKRRLLDLSNMGIESDLSEQEQDINRRDEFDSGREHSPLTIAEDAVVIDTTNLTIEKQVDRIVELFQAAG